MKKIIISIDYFSNYYSNKEKFIKILQQNNDKFLYFIITKNIDNGLQIVKNLKNYYNLNCEFLFRDSKTISNLDFEAIIGRKNFDFYIATNNKKIIFYDENFLVEEKVYQYGFKFSIDILDKLLKIIELEKTPYCYAKINNNVEMYSLLDARSKKIKNISLEEGILVEEFENLIKRNTDIKNKNLIMYYILLAIRSLITDMDINYISYYPSSKIGSNVVMEDITKNLRNIFHLPIETPELLIRTKNVQQSKILDYADRLSCVRHFFSISLNNINLENKTILILDDYSTNGTSFETTRNFFKNIRINKIIFISVGNFGKKYVYQDYLWNSNTENFELCYLGNIETYKFPEYNETLEKLVNILNEKL